LEDRFRPTHFAGVATVVAKLLIQAMPDLAVFGEKDFQQLAVIRQLTRDLDLPITIAGGPTLRETDGLAMSSRNVYLSTEERATAPLLQRVLSEAAAAIQAGEDAEHVLTYGRERIAQAGFALDYLEWRDATSLGLASRDKASRLLVAARIGKTRLIDNVGVAAGV
jgi:pantoate--beta-alanine ligase